MGIVTGGGSGHLPVFTGYVVKGLLDACAIGDVLASPSSEQMADALRVAEQGGDLESVTATAQKTADACRSIWKWQGSRSRYVSWTMIWNHYSKLRVIAYSGELGECRSTSIGRPCA